MLTTPRNRWVQYLLLFIGVATLSCGGDDQQPPNMAMSDLQKPDDTEILIGQLKERAKKDLGCMYLGYMIVKKCSSKKGILCRLR